MKKNMCNLLQWIFHQCGFGNLAFCCKIHIIFICIKIILLFQKFDCFIIIVLLVHQRCLIQHRTLTL